MKPLGIRTSTSSTAKPKNLGLNGMLFRGVRSFETREGSPESAYGGERKLLGQNLRRENPKETRS